VIAGNVATLRERVAPAGLMAVVKADGYGHGSVDAARAALDGGADRLAVVHVAEALRLRAAGITAPVLCLMSLPADPHEEAIARDVDLSASTPAMVTALARAAGGSGKTARVHLKADTGLSRGGASPSEWPALVETALACEQVEIAALWSHFASSDEPGNPSVEAQLAAFEEASEAACKLGVDQTVTRHLANTAAGITVPESRFDFVRFGGGIYGVSTLPGGLPPGSAPR
jgi:alanine racemase